MSCTHCGSDHEVGGVAICPLTGRSLGDHGLIGELVAGKYRVLRMLGIGGMGEVYECEHIGVGRKVCVKRLLPEFRTQPLIMQRFEREARVAAAIEHENVIEIFDVGMHDDGSPFFVMPRLLGDSLATLVAREGALAVDRTARLMSQVLSALEAAHDKKIIHRDLKPDNCFVVKRASGDEQIKLLDFGISKIDDGNASLTRTGTLVGTPAYMSPEQARGQRDLDLRVDLWAAGVMLFELLAGRPPFEAATYHGMLIKIVVDAIPHLGDHRLGLPAGLLAIVDRAMHSEIEARYASASEFLDDLRPWMDYRDGRTPEVVPLSSLAAGGEVDDSYPVLPRLKETASSLARHSSPRPTRPSPMRDAGEDVHDTEEAPAHSHDALRELSLSTNPPGVEPSDVLALSARRRPRTGLLAAVAVVVAGGGVALAWLAHERSLSAASPQVTVAPAPVAAAGSAPVIEPAPQPASTLLPVAAPAGASPSSTLALTLWASPADARLFIDGASVDGNPFRARFPRDGAAHQVMASAAGYQSSRALVIFDGDHRVSLSLEHAHRPAATAPGLPHLPSSAQSPPEAVAPRHAPATPTDPVNVKKGKLITDYP